MPSNFTVKDTSKQGHKGDFVITYSRDGTVKTCMIDIKNYSSTVPKKEIDKFLEDLTFGTYDCGLLISYNTKFVGIPEHIYFEDFMSSSGKIPVLYLTSNEPEIILQAVQLVISKTIISAEKSLEITKAEAIIETINSALVQSADTRRLLSELVSNTSKTAQKCQEHLVTHEAHIKKALRELSGCISKVMINKILPHVPKLEARQDNLTEEFKKTDFLAGTTANDIPANDIPDNNVHTNDINTTSEVKRISMIYKPDRNNYETLVSLNWEEVVYPNDKTICELRSKNITLKVNALKTKTTVILDFLESIEIDETEFTALTYRVSKDDSFICTLDEPLIKFIKKFMN